MVRTQSLNLIRNKDKMQPRPSCMVRSSGKTYRQIDILMFDSPVPLSGLAKFKIWWNFCKLLANKLHGMYRKQLFCLKLSTNRMQNDIRLDPETKLTIRLLL